MEQEEAENEPEPEPEANFDFLSEPEPEPEPEPDLPDPADLFTFKDYSEITKKIQTYKTSNDTNGYNQWIFKYKRFGKCFVSIRANFNKSKQDSLLIGKKYFDSVLLNRIKKEKPLKSLRQESNT